MTPEQYKVMVSRIVDSIIVELEKIQRESDLIPADPTVNFKYDVHLDEDLLGEVFWGETNKSMVIDPDLSYRYSRLRGEAMPTHLVDMCQSIVGNCYEPVLNFTHQYRKDTFLDYAQGCLLTDVLKEYNSRVDIPYEYEFWNRAR